MSDPTSDECTYCKGTGVYTGMSCHYCGGDGIKPLEDSFEYILAHVRQATTTLAAMQDKLDSIIAEQGSQRIDLEAALLQIWNKVKDL